MAVSLVLASSSPRRRRLLSSAGLVFDVEHADVDEEHHAGESPIEYVERVARRKADAVAARLAGGDRVILAADTTVAVDGAILAKPADDDDARRMLRLLSGRSHHAHTAVVARRGDLVRGVTVTTEVTFVPLSEPDIAWYLSTGEHRDKAGAYGMQGAAGAFVERIDGSPSNVIGLPLAETLRLLRVAM